MASNQDVFEAIERKHELKQQVSKNTGDVFEMLKKSAHQILDNVKKTQQRSDDKKDVKWDYINRNSFEFEFCFSSDVLLFTRHTNVFEFSRDHLMMKTSYIKEDKNRSYCGMIQIYNFLADSLYYRRENDLGYLIGRIFVNKDMHCFVEGKQELGLLFNNFNTSEMTQERSDELLRSAMLYTTNFDLLIPPFDEVKEISVADIQSELSNMSLGTGKRMGFKFQADNI